MKTLVALENSNCTRCHNHMLGTLREREGVQHVRSVFSAGCLVVEHEDDPQALVALITTAERAVAVAANGERVMVPVDGHEAAECRESNDPARERLAEQTVAVTTPGRTDCPPGSATRPQPNTWSSGVTASPVGLPVPGCDRRRGGQGGVRVLSRERPAPGLVFRAAGALIRMFRFVFRVPAAPR